MTFGDLEEALELIYMLESHFANVLAGDEGDDEHVKSDKANLEKCKRVRKSITKFIKKGASHG